MTFDPGADKATELSRYDARAKEQLQHPKDVEPEGSASFSPPYRTPYLFYEETIRRLVRPDTEVLELGAGTGVHTRVLVETGARVTALDISPAALDVLSRRIGPAEGRLRTRVGDIEAPPVADSSFDFVVCAGSLSYGDSARVDAGIRRVLRPGGSLVCVDSLNHNPVYRLNRLTHYLRGHRTRSTLMRMPTLDRIQSLAGHFQSAEVRFFGGFSWAMPLVERVVGPARAASFSDALDRLFHVRRFAFKFVLVAQGRK